MNHIISTYAQLKLYAANQIDAGSLGLPKVVADNNTLHAILSAVFVFIGSWATIFLLVGAFRYIVSNGNQSQIKQAKDTILYAAVGLGISTLAFTIVQFVLGNI
jgi:hypothetical protein